MKLDKKKKAVGIILASLSGISGATVASMVVAYDTFFPRYERPNYRLQAGQYCMERMGQLKRTEIWIPSKTAMLKAYSYMPKKPKGLVVFAHGIKAGADDYLPIIDYLYKNDFAVLSYNMTGTFESEGESTVGMCQFLVDIDYVIKYVQRHKPYKNYPLFTMGHSMGGYAAASVMAIREGIKASAVIAAVRNGSTMMLEKGEQFAGKIAKIAKPVFNCYQRILFTDYNDYDAIIGINKQNVPVLIAQGVDDKVVVYNKQSILAEKDKITNPNVKYYVKKGIESEHSAIWHSLESIIYQKKVASELNLLEFEKGSPLTDDEKAEFIKTVDHRLYSEVNYELMDEIIKMFNSVL